jgi:hypothetical protein
MEIEIDEKAHELVAAAILSTITGEARDKLLASAVASLIEPQKDCYNRDKLTPLQEAFNHSVGRVAERVVEEFVQGNEEFKAAIAAKVQKSLVDAVAQQRVDIRVDIKVGDR